MRVSRMFAAFCLYASDTESTHVTQAGIGQLRHKSRHSGTAGQYRIEAPENPVPVKIFLPLR